MWYVFNVITSVGRQIDVYWPIKIHESYRPTVFLNVIAALHVKNRIYIKITNQIRCCYSCSACNFKSGAFVYRNGPEWTELPEWTT